MGKLERKGVAFSAGQHAVQGQGLVAARCVCGVLAGPACVVARGRRGAAGALHVPGRTSALRVHAFVCAFVCASVCLRACLSETTLELTAFEASFLCNRTLLKPNHLYIKTRNKTKHKASGG